MAWQAHPSVVPLSLGAGLLVANAFYLALRKRTDQRAPGQWLAVALVACFAVSVGAFALESLHTGLGTKVFWNQIQYVGDATIPAFLLGYVLVYVGYDHTRKSLAALFVLPAVTLVAVFTNPLHSLFWPSLSLERLAGLVVLTNGHGPLFYLYLLYTYVFVLVALGLLAHTAFDSEGVDRTHLGALMVAILAPAIAGIVYVLELGVTPTPNYPGYAYLFAAGIITYSVHRQDLFQLVPVARRTTIEQMGEGVVVLDTESRVVSANDTAHSLLGHGDALVGRPATAMLGPLDSLDFDASHQETTVETADHVLDVTVEPLIRGERQVGSLLVLQDVTERYRRQQTLEAQNRKLELLNKLVRHDIRNEATLIRNVANRVDTGATPSEENEEFLSRIVDGSDRIVGYTDQARDLMAVILQLTEALDSVPLEPILDREIAGASTIDATATLRVDGEIPDVRVRANEMLGSLVRNLLVNAIQHNDSEAPTALVAVERHDGEVTFTVSDDGPGIPESERNAVFVEGKTLAGSDGTGFGLYLVATLVDQYGGSVEIDDSDLGGAAVSVTLAVADERAETGDDRPSVGGQRNAQVPDRDQ